MSRTPWDRRKGRWLKDQHLLKRNHQGLGVYAAGHPLDIELGGRVKAERSLFVTVAGGGNTYGAQWFQPPPPQF